MSKIDFQPNGHFGINGITIHPGSDVDADLIKVNVTGTPTLIWDESESKFSINTGLNIIGSSDIVQQVIRANATQVVSNIAEIQKSDKAVLAGFDERGVPFCDLDTDTSNYFAGANAGNSTMSAAFNVLIGKGTGRNITTGGNNMMFGDSSGDAITEGSNNTGVGRNTLSALVTGNNNVAIGTSALALNIASANVSIGSASLTANVGGIRNTAVGANAGWGNTEGDNNVNIGDGSGFRNATGSNNVHIGKAAGQGAVSGATARSNNTFIGTSSGLRVTSASDSIYIGNLSGSRQTNLSDLLIIDNQNRADIATELTNSILYGVMGATPANQSLRINAALTVSEGITTEAIETITTTTSLDDTHFIVLCNASSAGFTIDLPASSGNAGLNYHIKKIDSSVNVVTIDGNASETIDGDLTLGITAQYESLHLVCDGSNWHVL